MSIAWLAIPGIALAAVALMVWSSRASRGQGGLSGTAERRVDAVDRIGVHAGDAVASWSSIFEVAVVTRRTIGGHWFGLELQSDDVGPLLIDGSGDVVEPFLAETYRLSGFDHEALATSLAANRPRTVCFRR